MSIAAFGRFWDRDLVDWHTSAWRLLGRRGLNTGTIRVVDFRFARGIYVLYNEVGVYYVGLATGKQGIGGRLRNHLDDDHWSRWSKFSWFSFDSPKTKPDSDRTYSVAQSGRVRMDTPLLIRDMEALLQVATQPHGNRNQTQFQNGSEWTQVATAEPTVISLGALAPRL